jgi:ubiquinol-cytochrome c reductase cytochrome c1 subunit
MKKFLLLTLLILSPLTLAATEAKAGGGEVIKYKEVEWPFDGPLGKVDKVSAQRGLQVYKEVCAACHALSLVSYRDLSKIGFSEAEIKAIAADKTVKDGPNDDGEMFDRPALPSDKFASPFPNKNAAKAANNGAYPVNFSLITKARHDGPNYIYSLLTGYEPAPAGFDVPSGLNYNKYFPGHKIAMAAPLTTEGQVTYQDGTKATVEQMAKDVVNFLQWAAEPEMDTRKQMGIKVLLFVSIFTIFFYIAKVRIWAKLDEKN